MAVVEGEREAGGLFTSSPRPEIPPFPHQATVESLDSRMGRCGGPFGRCNKKAKALKRRIGKEGNIKEGSVEKRHRWSIWPKYERPRAKEREAGGGEEIKTLFDSSMK